MTTNSLNARLFKFQHGGIVVAALLTIFATAAAAEKLDGDKYTCQSFSQNSWEPIGDRENHVISVGQLSCHTDSGFAEGAISTSVTMFEVDKGNAKSLSGSGVMRKTGGIAVYEITQQTWSLIMTDGKVTGFQGTGKALFTFASGSLAAYAGKTRTYTYHSTPGGQLKGESTYE